MLFLRLFKSKKDEYTIVYSLKKFVCKAVCFTKIGYLINLKRLFCVLLDTFNRVFNNLNVEI